jgi:hypothetical protein
MHTSDSKNELSMVPVLFLAVAVVDDDGVFFDVVAVVVVSYLSLFFSQQLLVYDHFVH